MPTRRKIAGKYYNVRAKSSTKGKKGTISGKWKHPAKNTTRKLTLWQRIKKLFS